MKPIPLQECYPIEDGLLIAGPALDALDFTPTVLARYAALGLRSMVHLLSREQFLAAGPDALLPPCVVQQDDCRESGLHLIQRHHCFWPLADDALPTARQIRLTLDTMDQALRDNPSVLVHGAGNPLRAIIAAGCWLARHGCAEDHSDLGRLTTLCIATGCEMTRIVLLSDAHRELILGWPRGQ